jgi:hypothetical protein
MATQAPNVFRMIKERPTHVRYWVVVFAVSLAIFSYMDRVALSRAAGTISKELGLNKEQMGWSSSPSRPPTPHSRSRVATWATAGDLGAS